MSWMIWPGNPVLSLLILFLIAIPFLYAARRPMHGLIRSISRVIANALRLGARWLMHTAEELRSRNKVVLLAHGREEISQAIDREFERVGNLVRRDLQGYPTLQRKLMDEITRIEEDYKKCGEVPPPPPEWTKAVTVIAKIKSSEDGLVEKILEDISTSIEKIYDRVLRDYRRSYERRHKILGGFLPFWRSLDQTLTRVDRNLNGLQESASRIDAQMERYEEITAESEKIEHALTSSAATQFFIASVVLLVAAGGAFVNFWLIARPMSAMVGGGEYIVGGLEASHIAALVIILVEATMGLFLMESLRITHLFPRINNMNDKMRIRIVWVSFTILLILAGVEVALAIMRDQIIAADIALKLGLGDVETTAAVVELGWVGKIPVAGQMILGFVLPFALAFVAIPLEYFIYSARTVIGVGLVLTMRALGFVLRFSGNVVKNVGTTLVMIYDVVIFIPLMIERLIQSKRGDLPDRKEGKAADVAAFRGEALRRTGGKGL
ncbi:MAG: hypothetical protein BMS9Abin22_481 [Gammaproteobacteria bacterium]|nr:MAG: hypothetical protein BMS9Abin22_481 [Gammaproteobacteria bacterium]